MDTRVQHQSFQIPVFGIVLHENDIWIVGGVFSLVAMTLLHEFMKRELESIQSFRPWMKTKLSKQLILSTQIFASPNESVQYAPSWFVRQLVFLLLYFLPFILQLIALFNDTHPIEGQWRIATELLGKPGAILEYVLESVSVILLAIIGWKCNSTGMQIDSQIREIGKVTTSPSGT
jgi:hypothetical protein